jgi:hypothetical protein
MSLHLGHFFIGPPSGRNKLRKARNVVCASDFHRTRHPRGLANRGRLYDPIKRNQRLAQSLDSARERPARDQPHAHVSKSCPLAGRRVYRRAADAARSHADPPSRSTAILAVRMGRMPMLPPRPVWQVGTEYGSGARDVARPSLRFAQGELGSPRRPHGQSLP